VSFITPWLQQPKKKNREKNRNIRILTKPKQKRELVKYGDGYICLYNLRKTSRETVTGLLIGSQEEEAMGIFSVWHC
jgi:hypothetical protein